MFSLNWRFAINEYQTTYAAMYLAKDGNSFFRIGSQPNNGVRDTRLEQYNLEGELINHFSLGTTTLLYTHKHPLEIPNSNSSFFMARYSGSVLFIDPDAQTYWNQLVVDDYVAQRSLKFGNFYVNIDGNVVTDGQIITPATETTDRVFEHFIGMVDQQGNFNYQIFPNAKYLNLQRIQQSDRFIVVGHYHDEYAEQTGIYSFIQELDHELVALNTTELEQAIYASIVGSDSFVGEKHETRGIYDFSGNLIRETDFPSTAPSAFRFGKNIFYVISHIENDIIHYQEYTIFTETQQICQFDYQFKQNWCRNTRLWSEFENAQILENDALGVTFKRELINLADVTLGLNSLTNALVFEADVRATNTIDLFHEIYLANGKLSAQVDEPNYSHTGHLYRCFFAICVEEEEYTGGVKSSRPTLFISENSLISHTYYYANPEANGLPRLTRWSR